MKHALSRLGLWLLALVGIALFLIGRTPRPAAREKFWPVPPFKMVGVTALGQTTLRKEDLLGHPWVADFIFTRCAGPCPLMSLKMAALQRVLPPAVRLVSFSVDPDHDTPEVLQAYAKRFGADPRRWIFVRGEKEALHRLIYAGFRLSLAENRAAPPGFQLAHSTRFALVDAEGVIRGFYDSAQPSFIEALRRDMGS